MQKSKFNFKVVIIVMLCVLLLAVSSAGIFYATNKAKASTVETSLDAYARYDASTKQIVMGTEKVKRVVSFVEGKYMTTELTDLVSNNTYVNAGTKQNEFGFDVG